MYLPEEMPTSPPKVSILILTYNSLTRVGSLFKKVINATCSANEQYTNSELVIVDNASTDGTLEYLLDTCDKRTRIYRLRRNTGYALGNNIGSELIGKDTDYILIVNDDCVLVPEALQDLVKFAEKDEKAGVIQGIICTYQEFSREIVQCKGFFIDFLGFSIPRFLGFRVNEVPEVSSYVSYISGACMLIRRKALEDVHGILFSEKLFAYYEDAELCMRLWTRGWKSVALPVLTSYHRGHATSPPMKYYLFRNRIISMLPYFARYTSLKPYLLAFTAQKLAKLPRYFLSYILSSLKGNNTENIKYATKGNLYGLLQRHCLKYLNEVLGPHVPLLLVPQSPLKALKKAITLSLLRGEDPLFRSYIENISTLTLTDRHLRELPTPFLVKI